MKFLHRLNCLLACALLTGCGGMSGNTASAPPSTDGTTSEGTSFGSAPHVANDLMRAGDKVTIRLEGVPDNGYATIVQIPSTGEITVPLLTTKFQAAGRTSSDLANEISEAYKSNKIYTNPHVTVISEERYVNVSGDVRGPSRVPYTSDLTLLGAIASCGGFTEYANRRVVRIIRGKETLTVDCVAAAKTPGADPPVYPGDQIYVPRTMF